MAASLGLDCDIDALIDAIIERTPGILDAVGVRPPDRFPVSVFDAVRKGMLDAAGRLTAEPSHRS